MGETRVGRTPTARAAARAARCQAHLYLGHLTVPRRHPDYEALELAAVMLGSGAGLTGRIPQRIRDREGLAYSAHAQTVAGAGLDPGRLVAYVATSVHTVDQAERGVREEIARLVEDGITDEELADARSYLLGREPFERETARQWADLLVEAEHYHLPLDDPDWRHRPPRRPRPRDGRSGRPPPPAAGRAAGDGGDTELAARPTRSPAARRRGCASR